MKTQSSRREFLKKSVAISSMLLLPRFVHSMDLSPDPLIRQNMADLKPNSDIVLAYKDAVRKMQALGANDPKSWISQANLHVNHCPHGNWFFLPWHRAYLYYFEAICRELSGMSNFALPYWDWTTSREIPEHFWGDGNPLFVNRRAKADTAADPRNEFVAENVIERILNINDFEVFASSKAKKQRDMVGSGELESRPHNFIHNFIGGVMGTMRSPLDPVFWCHHANVDRIWHIWNAMGHQNSKDSDWLNHEFKEFHGTPGAIKIKELLNTKDLNYNYDTPIAPVVANSINSKFKLLDKEAVFEKSNNKLATLNSVLKVGIHIGDKFEQAILSAVQQEKSNTTNVTRDVNLVVDEVKYPKERALMVRVFVNCAYLDENTPISDPHYVGSFTFFGDHEAHAGHDEHHAAPENTMAYKFRLTETLAKLSEENALPEGTIQAQLLTLPLFDDEVKLGDMTGVLSSNFRVEIVKSST